MSKSVEILPNEDADEIIQNKKSGKYRQSNFSESRLLSRSAIELPSEKCNESFWISQSPEQLRHQFCSPVGTSDSPKFQINQYRHTIAQRTHAIFTSIKSKWIFNRNKDRRKCKSILLNDSSSTFRKKTLHDSDEATDYSSAEQSRNDSTNQSPAKRYLHYSTGAYFTKSLCCKIILI